MNTTIESIKLKLGCITEVNENTICSGFESDEINYNDNPLNPDLMSYCFDNVLGFNVKYRICEKVNYAIYFDYKGYLSVATHKKLSYTITVASIYREEIIQLFISAKELLEQLFNELSENALQKNEFSIDNQFLYYEHKYKFLKTKIEETNDLIKVNLSKINELTEFTIKSIKKYNSYSSQRTELRKELVYYIEYYIDVFYSFLEHILILLYPLSIRFNIDEPFIARIRNPKWGWNRKLMELCSEFISEELFQQLKFIKEVYRNRNAHGLFSSELKVFIQIPDFGRYPLYIGKEHLKGFIEDNPFKIDYDLYMKCTEVFDEVFQILENNYSLPLHYIKSGLPVHTDIYNWIIGFSTIDELEEAIIAIYYHQDNQVNMDW